MPGLVLIAMFVEELKFPPHDQGYDGPGVCNQFYPMILKRRQLLCPPGKYLLKSSSSPFTTL
jgi:hypothetical protein